MPDISPLAVAVATLVAFLLGGGYYALLGTQLARTRVDGDGTSSPRWAPVAEIGRCLLIALVVAGLIHRGDIENVGGAVLLGLALWIGFPLVLWIGAVVHERTPVSLAAIHAGDWLLKLPAVAAVISVLQ